ncbi:MAG: aldehyde ferredoxin oxidoreductase family protein [Trueperaceae bacterium]|nr:aldehyde ferredoxin oxidoreductase family protein [Trueperaceae bacterium]
MQLGGYANRVARIDLSSAQVSYEGLNEDHVRKYVGARGLGVKYLLDHGPQVDPMSPDNMLAIMNGPLSGTDVKMSGRLAVVTKSPLTGTVTDSHMGGWTAAKIKWAGFDGLVVTGKADKPTYAFVEDGQVSLHDASEYWGMSTSETVKALRDKHGDKAAVMCIGQAGENLVKYASIMNEDQRAAGRGGTGCVMGNKNLKAIVILGDRKNRPKPVDKDAFKEADKRALATIMDEANVTSPKKGGLSVYGTNVLMNITNTIGALPARNSQVTSFADAEAVSGEAIREFMLTSEPTCHACPVACKKEVEFEYNGQTIKTESYEYETAWALGPNCFHGDRNAVGYMLYLCNEYGMDTIEAGNACSAFMEATEKGYLNGDTAEGLAWGDADKQVELIEKIAFRRGVGNKLAEGPEAFARAVGHPEISMTVKGQGIPAYDPRGLKGMGIGYATSNRGACHLRAYTPASEILGVGEKTDPIAWEGKGKLTALLQDLHAFSDSLDVCKFSAFAEGAQEYADQYAAFVGLEGFSPEDVLKTGERIYNLERHYNNLAGFGEGSDTLPQRFLDEPSESQGSVGQVAELGDMLNEYYGVRGWSNGVVPESKLKELGIL